MQFDSMENQADYASRAETELTSIEYHPVGGNYRYVQMQQSKAGSQEIPSAPIRPPVFGNDLEITADKVASTRDRWASWVKITSLVYGTFAFIDLMLLLVYSNRFGNSYQMLILETILDCGMIFASWLGRKASKLKDRKSAKVYFKTLVFFGSLYLVYLLMLLMAAPYHEISAHILWETGYGRRLTQQTSDRKDLNFNDQLNPEAGSNFFLSPDELKSIQYELNLTNQETVNFSSWVLASKLSISENSIEDLITKYLQERNSNPPTKNLRKTQEENKNDEQTRILKEDADDIDDTDDINSDTCNHVSHIRIRERRKKIEFIESIVKICAAFSYVCAVVIFVACFWSGLKLYKTSSILEKQYPVYSMSDRVPVQAMLFQPAGQNHI